MKPVIAVAIATAIGAIVGTVWVGSRVREETVVARPYEEGLRSDADREARLRLGWTVQVAGPVTAAGPLAFEVKDARGAALDGAEVALTASRPGSGRGQVRAAARAAGAPGRYVADVAFPAAGGWDVLFDVRRGEDRVRLTRAVSVAPAAAACDLGAGPCEVTLDGVTVRLEVGPRPLRTMAELAVSATLRADGAPLDGAVVALDFRMPGMEMGRNVIELSSLGGGRYTGKAVLVRCPSGRRDYEARVFYRRGPKAKAIHTQALALGVAE